MTAPNFMTLFFSRMGVEVTIQVDDDNDLVFIVETGAFEHRRPQIEAWFTPVHQDAERTVLKERQRGTGGTRT